MNPRDIAVEVRRLIRARYALVASCIETSYLFEQVVRHLELPCQRVVAQAVAFTPAVAAAIEQGMPIEDIGARIGEEGWWSVGVGMAERPGDFVGRMQPEENRYVGHVLCWLPNEPHPGLVDPSADQMSRPHRGLAITEPVVTWPCLERDVVFARARNGVVVRYVLHWDVAPPLPKTQRYLDRRAAGLARHIAERCQAGTIQA